MTRRRVSDRVAREVLDETLRAETSLPWAVLDVLRRLGLHHLPASERTGPRLAAALGICPAQEEQWRLMLTIAARAGFLRWDQDQLVLDGSFHDEAGLADALADLERMVESPVQGIGPKFALLLEVLKAYPEILRGTIKPHTVLFPGGSMQAALKMYEGDPIQDSQNRALAELITACVAAWSRAIRDRPIRILEVGAGTGASSKVVLAALAASGHAVRYTYTDVSAGFFLPIQGALSEAYPFVEFRPYDAERPPEDQGFERHSMDLVFGTNCFHATACMRNTLQQTKKLLRRNGVLVLNELLLGSMMGSLAWGSVPGWWSATDRQYRVEAAPFLPLESWLKIFSMTGFRDPRMITVPTAPPHASAVLAVESDGWIESEVAPTAAGLAPAPSLSRAGSWLAPPVREPAAAAPVVPAAAAAPAVAAPQVSPQPPSPTADPATLRHLRQVFSEVLRVPVESLGEDRSFDAFGIDSLVSMSLNRRLEEDLGKLPATLLFEYTTLRSLAEYLQAHHRDRLPGGPDESAPEAPEAPAAPAPGPGDLESWRRWLTEVFSETLRIPPERLQPEHAFDRYGIDSLVSLTLNRRLEQDLGKLPATLLFEYNSLESLAAFMLRTHTGGPPATTAAPAPEVPAPEVSLETFPLSPVQRQIWYLQRLDPEGTAYHVIKGARSPSSPDIPTLTRALEQVSGRHAMLRASFVEQAGVPVGQVHPEAPVALREVDLRHLSPEPARARALELARAESRRPYDLGHPPLLRTLVVHLPGGECAQFLMAHHIIVDGMAMAVLGREIGEAYQALREGRPLEPPGRTRDFPEVCRQRAAEGAGRAGLEHFLGELEGSHEARPLAADFPEARPDEAPPPDGGGQVLLHLEADCGRAAGRFARDHGATPFIFYFSVFATLLHRYSSLEDFNLGTVAFNRAPEDLEVVGPFANTVPLRVRLSGTQSFLEVMHTMRTTLLEALRHPDVSMEELVAALGSDRKPQRNPLFQVVFNYINHPDVTALTAGPGRDRDLPVDGGASQFDLSMDLFDWKGSLQVLLEYRTGTFRRETIEGLGRHFATLVAAVQADPGAPIQALPYLDPEEADWILRRGRSGETPPPATRVLDEELLEVADHHPEDLALLHQGTSCSYRQLRRRVLRFAAALRADGVAPGDRVALVDAPSPEQVAAMLAVWRAGATLVPVDPDWTAERTRQVLEHAAVARVVTTRPGEDLEAAPQTLHLAPDPEPEEAWDEAPAPSQARLEGVAILIYTSGTQGRPKGVMVRHQNLADHVRVMRDVYRMQPGDRLQQFAAPGFDLFLEEVLVPLAEGRTVVLRDPSLPLDAVGLHAHLAAHAVSHVSLSASHWHTLLETAPGLALPECVKVLVVGNERVSAGYFRRWRRCNPAVRFVNAYGPTETTITSLVHEVEGDSVPGSSVPIGRPLPGEQVTLVDPHLQLVPAGVPGEILIGGAGVAEGYWNQPEASAARFLPDPFAPESGKRVYRTGDLARWTPDGILEFLGRNDDQVKLRGHRIELEEVEWRLLEHPHVLEGAVALRGTDQDATLEAFVRWAGPDHLPRRELLAFLAARLPGAMVPTAVYRVEDFPRLGSGKIDRRGLAALRRDEQRFRDPPGPASPPRTETEQALARIFQELTGAPALGTDLDFFRSGGTSLRGLQLLHRIRERFGVALDARSLYQDASLAALARRIDQGAGAASAPPDALSLLRPGVAREGLVLLPGSGASTLSLVTLAQRLKTRRSVYAFDWNALVRDETAETVESLAAHGAEALIGSSDLRRFTVLGWSMGGILGYELVAALEARGVVVDRLILLDSYWPEDVRLFDLMAKEAPGALAQGVTPEQAQEFLRTMRRSDSLFARYENGHRRSVRAALFTARDFPGDPEVQESAAQRWDRHFDRPLERRVVEGDHFSMLRAPQVDSLASQIEDLLEDEAA